jgi:hypothetical protein
VPSCLSDVQDLDGRARAVARELAERYALA